MNVFLIPWIGVTILGASALAVGGYFILRSPFGAEPLTLELLIGAIILLMAGLIIFTYGATKSARLLLNF